MTERKTKAESPSFEKSMERLERIVADMEGGELSLDAMIRQFEEGQGLIRFCSGKLDEVERKIEKLLSKDGPVQTAPFPDADVSPDADPDDRDGMLPLEA